MRMNQKAITDWLNAIVIIFFFILSGNCCFSQSRLDSITGSRHYAKAEVFLERGDRDSAAHYFSNAAFFFEKAEAWLTQANCLNKMSEVSFAMSRYDDASTYADQAVVVIEEKIGKENEALVHAISNLGKAVLNSGFYDKSLELHQKAIAIGTRLIPQNHKLMAESYLNAGIALNYKKDHQQAIEYLNKALSLAFTLRNHNSLVPNINTTIGIVYWRIGEYKMALSYFEKSIALYNDPLFQGSLRDKQAGLSRTYNYIGSVNYALGKYHESLFYFNRSFPLILSIHGDKSPAAIGYFRQVGDVYDALNNFTKANEFFQKALSVASELFGTRHPAIVTIYTNMSLVLIKQGNYDLALHYLQQSIVANTLSFYSTDDYTLPVSNSDFQDFGILYTSLTVKADLLRKIYQRNGNLKMLEEALKTCQLMDTLLFESRRTHLNIHDKASLGSLAIINCENGIDVSLKLHSITHEHKFLEYAFYFSESNKAGILREALQDMAAKGIGLIPDTLVALEKKIKEQQIVFQSRILQAKRAGNHQLQEYQNKLFALNRSMDSLKLRLDEDYPIYYRYKYQNDLLGVAELQRSLPKSTVMIEFFEGNENLYVFTMTSSKLSVYSVPADSVYTDLIDRFRKSIVMGGTPEGHSRQNFHNFCTASHELYDLLLRRPLSEIKVEERIDQIFVIPDGLVSYLPVDILLTKKMHGGAGSYAGLDYLLNDYTVNYGYSAALSVREADRNVKAKLNYIAFAPDYYDGSSDPVATRTYGKFRNVISSLKWNQTEVMSISENVAGESYITSAATEGRFKKEAGNFGIIHLAMHAVVDEEDPMNSSLVFSIDNDSAEDCLLHAFELYNMQLNARMAVLSACNTGYGKLVKGEGIMSLARAFSYAGVPSVVMSHWSVDDKATSMIMQYFYENLDKGMTKSEALRQAKRLYLSTADESQSHPFYWAAFLNIGEDSPIAFEKDFYSIYVWIGLPCLMTALFFFVVMKKRTRRHTA